MNIKLVLFSSLITACLGAVLGIGIAEISENPHISRHYQGLHLKFALGGAALGAAVGAGQESVREAKIKQGSARSSFLVGNHHER